MALAFLVIEISMIEFKRVQTIRFVPNQTFTLARVIVPVEIFLTGDGLALALTVEVVPVEIVGADHWAADARADIVVPDFAGFANIFGRRANTNTTFSVKVGICITFIYNSCWIAFTATSGSVPK